MEQTRKETAGYKQRTKNNGNKERGKKLSKGICSKPIDINATVTIDDFILNNDSGEFKKTKKVDLSIIEFIRCEKLIKY
ncbi:hypothetical protein [Bacillus cereus]|uniref:Uncharacterized protein n=1 Tax=Bacillus cereus TaxID=1396 RepID=A0A9X7G5F7_BACCE|nr:hypothetical protein [Bacillus cereus]PED43147.1 hypothetical protein CON26_15890 [Bacillus cereus]PFV02858.1 hypothetical protein COK98_25885 [Bacillus cereus]